MLKITFIISLLVVLAGCAATENYKKYVRSWVGKHSDNLSSSWGPPTSEETLLGGGKVLVFIKSEDVDFPGVTITTSKAYGPGWFGATNTDYQTQHVPGHKVNLSCVTSFITDSSGIIIDARWEGNNCVVE